MLISEPTKHAAGLIIYGDYLDLDSLHQTIHYLEKGIPLDAGENMLSDFVLGLAYDVRHACQGDRFLKEFGDDEDDTVTYFGFEALFPYILPQVGLMRWAASFHPTDRTHQADLFRIEECIRHALFSIDPVIGKEAFDWLASFSGFPENYYIQFFNELALEYVTRAKSPKTRFRYLPKLLYQMEPSSEKYRVFAEQLEIIAEKQNCNPHQLEDRREWGDFRW